MTFDDLKPLIDWLEANPGLAGFATFLISIAESLAFVGLLIPGTIVMGAIGTLIGAGILPGIPITLWAIAGAIVGDGLSYWLGHHYHGHIREMWPFRSYPSFLQKGEAFFHKHGGKSIFLGRFIGPVRPMIPVIAGMLNMSPMHFTIANVLSAIAWAPAYMLPGVLLGALSVQLAPETGTRFLVILVITLLVLWGICILLKWVFSWFFKRFQIPLPVILGSCLGALLLLTGAVYFKGTDILFNTLILHTILSIRIEAIDRVMTYINYLGDLRVLTVLFLLIWFWMLWKRQWLKSFYWWIAAGVIVGTVALFQWSIPSPYPYGLTLISPTEWSFPNLPIALSTLLFGYMALLGARRFPLHLSWFAAIAAILVFLVMLSELYFLKAWFNDAMGGLLLGASCLLALILWSPKQLFSLSIFGVGFGIFALLLAGIGMISQYYQPSRQHHVVSEEPTSFFNLDKWWEGQQLVKYPFRQGSIGKAKELLTIQWAGDLSAIEKALIGQGWEVAPKPDFATLVNRIAAKDQNQQLPLWPKFYRNRKPDLIMTKTVGESGKLLILRLWDAKVTLDKNLPLWVGSINERSVSGVDKVVTTELKASLSGFSWKQIPSDWVHCQDVLKKPERCSSKIILIR